MPPLSSIARRKKIDYFLRKIPKEAKILEIGCGSGWVRDYLKNKGYMNYLGLDINPPAEIIGDIRNRKELGLNDNSFDFIIAFEVFEHVNCIKECYNLLKPGGILMVTTPIPHMDWFLRILELFRLNQKRLTPHSNLIYLKDVPYFEKKYVKLIWFLSQWGLLIK